MRYRLRTLLIVMAVLPPALAGAYLLDGIGVILLFAILALLFSLGLIIVTGAAS